MGFLRAAAYVQAAKRALTILAVDRTTPQAGSLSGEKFAVAEMTRFVLLGWKDFQRGMREAGVPSKSGRLLVT